MSHNVCRLCMGKKDLLWIFSDKMVDNMQEIIHVTSGVLITKSDPITQMVCSTCCQITIKMYRFRTTSLKNDNDLKAKCANNSQLPSSSKGETSLESTTPNGASTSNTDIKLKNLKVVLDPITKPIPVQPQVPQKYRYAHPSIKDILKKYPNIKLPQMSLKSHFGAYITLLTDEVDEWYKEKNYTEDDIQNIRKRAINALAQENCPEVLQRKRKRKGPFKDQTPLQKNTESKADENIPTTIPDKKLSNDTALRNNMLPTVNGVTTKSVIKLKSENQVPGDGKIEKDNASLKANIKSKPPPSEKFETPNKEKNENETVNSNTSTNLKPLSSDTEKSEGKNTEKPNSKPKTDKADSNSDTNKDKSSNLATHVNSPSEVWLMLGDVDTSKKEDITLKSLLDGLKRVTPNIMNDSNLQEIESDSAFVEDKKMVQEPENASQNKLFVRNSTVEPPNIQVSEEPVVLSDSDDESIGNNISKDDTVATESITLVEEVNSNNVHSDQSTITHEAVVENHGSEVEKRDFARSLSLVPTEGSNIPDFSLLSTNKMNTLHRCKICDLHLNSQKELVKHCQRTHSKCPFCSKRFRSMMIREHHINNLCVGNLNSRLRCVRVVLERVDNVKHIRNKYSKAFEEFEMQSIVDVDESQQSSKTSTLSTSQIKLPTSPPLATASSSSTLSAVQVPLQPQTPSKLPKSPETKPNAPKNNSKTHAGENYDAETENAVRELEQFLETGPLSSLEKQVETSTGVNNSVDSTSSSAESVTDASSSNPDVICISDDEGDTIYQTKSNSDNKPKKTINITNNEFLKNVNLQDDDINLLKQILTEAAQRKQTDEEIKIPGLPENCIVDGGTARIKIFQQLRRYLQHYKLPIDITYSQNLKVNFKYARPPNPKKSMKDTWANMLPEDLKCTSNKKVPQKKRNTSHELPPHGSTRNTVRTYLPPKTPKIAPKPSGFPQKTNRTEKQTNTTQPAQLNNNLQTTVPSSSGIYLAPHCSVVSSPQVNQTFTTNTPVILNGTQNMYVSSGTSSFANIIIALPTSLVATGGTTSVTTLPAAQGPLPVIQSVMSGQQLEITSTATNSSAYSVPIYNNRTVQPTIRVKNLSELS